MKIRLHIPTQYILNLPIYTHYIWIYTIYIINYTFVAGIYRWQNDIIHSHLLVIL